MKKESISGIFFMICAIFILVFYFYNYTLTGNSILDIFLNPVKFVYQTGLVFIDIFSSSTIIVQSPQNTTYNFSVGNNYVIDLNVSSNRNISSWRYTLYDLRHDVIANDSVVFTPNITINAVRWSNKIAVFGNISSGATFNTNVTFFVNVPNSAPIIDNLTSQILVCEGSSLAYYFNVTDVDENVIQYSLFPQYPSSPFYIDRAEIVNLTSTMLVLFSGILDKDDIGGGNTGFKSYLENVSIADIFNATCCSDVQTTNITIIEINNAPVFENVGVQTVWTSGENSTFQHQIIINDSEHGTPYTSNLSLNLSFSGIALFSMNSTGWIDYTGNSNHLGVHNVTVCATDRALDRPHANITLCGQNGTNRSSCINFSITVTDENRAPNITSYSPLNLTLNVSQGDILTFNVSKYDPDGTIPDSFFYADNVLYSSLSNNFNDSYSYSFGCGTTGGHNLSIIVSDGDLFVSVSWTVNVSAEVCPSIPSSDGGGGGGGGGITSKKCDEKWGCSSWSECFNLKQGYESGNISLILMSESYKRCLEFNWSYELGNRMCGYQTRICNDLNKCNTNKSIPNLVIGCFYLESPNCTDGVQNCHDGGCEVLLDCGGPCSACATCTDGIRNQGEEEIDCGGVCKPCTYEQPKRPENVIFFFVIVSLILLIIILTLVLRYLNARFNYLKMEKKRKLLKEQLKEKP